MSLREKSWRDAEGGTELGEKILEMKHICKSFFGVEVLKDVSLDLNKGEVLALMGENGAGKSTLMKILSGAYEKTSGEIFIDGKSVSIKNPNDARKNGVAIVYQEISLVDEMSIADNMFLGAEVKKGIFRDKDYQKKEAQRMLDAFDIEASADEKVKNLSIAQQQMVEIAKCILFNARILILDEPTASLSEGEAEKLFIQMKKMKENGVSIIYISHRLPEVFQYTDRIMVLRDGTFIGIEETAKMTEDSLVQMMVGRDVSDMYIDKPSKGSNEIVLEVKNFTNKYLHGVNLQLKKGEVLGIAGLVGAGRTELARAIFGIDKLQSGELYINGKAVKIKSPADSIANSVVLAPEDRKRHGLVLSKSVAYNITLVVLNKFIHGFSINREKEKEIIDTYSHKLSIKMRNSEQCCLYLSGGNQQKVVVSKWLAAGAKIMIFDEPTRGIDIGARSEIYALMHELLEQGISIIMISSDMEEILNMSSRIAVMSEGKITAVLDRNYENEDLEKMQEVIMKYAVGVSENGN